MTILDIYELHEQIGKGGFGTVYRATDTSLGRTVALKVLHPQMAWDADFIQRFQREARLAAQLENPYVVTIYGVGEDQGRYFIAMRYYPGGSLADLQKKGPLPWDKCVSILGQVCEGLQQLHQQGWVHRDMKPSNILFDPQGRAVVADFGLARVLTSSTSSSGGVAGTPHYKAPELWRGRMCTR
ncbi:serine/threonine-protein kinase [Levilinea saccharolytica]|uniref:serine/threonine-protein kinase n=1 Tax=Levilinea saccharolytica TaxID=229921 RepID=UPI00078404CF|nr:serine/threonine-protein kinase [Levilinea saccharolytica]GAP18537.1 protein containing protein kinase domain [Levilinea saccharolytica]